jgi:hypothetical protein
VFSAKDRLTHYLTVQYFNLQFRSHLGHGPISVPLKAFQSIAATVALKVYTPCFTSRCSSKQPCTPSKTRLFLTN